MTSADIAVAAARQAGLDAAAVELLRDGSNALFRMGGGVVARVGRPGSTRGARREVEVARWLACEGIAVVRPVDDVEQPATVDDRPVTWWEELPPHRQATPAELGALLGSLHLVAPPAELRLGVLDPLAGFAERITAAAVLGDGDRAWLFKHLERLSNGWHGLPPGLPTGVIHGDAWQGNVAVTDDQSTVLLDLEHVTVGPPEWDLVHLAADYIDFGRLDEVEHRSFVDAYGGHDVTGWEGFRTMADVVELRWVCFALGQATKSPAAAAEARHRIACLRGEVPRPWTWHAL